MAAKSPPSTISMRAATPGSCGERWRSPSTYPSNLRNIAIWNYWTNAEWAVEIGVGGTRICKLWPKRSDGYGSIPLGPERTSIGLVIPADYYKEKGQKTEEIYYEALKADGIVSRLTRNARPEPKVHTTRDWSFVADRLAGENWFLVGESAGFADPILSAGMSLSMSGARKIAYAILEIEQKRTGTANGCAISTHSTIAPT